MPVKSIAYSNKYGPPPEHIRVAVEAIECAELFPAFEGSGEIRSRILNPTIEKIELDQISADKGLKKMTDEINEMLKNSPRK